MNTMLTVAFCTFNRAERLSDLVTALRRQFCSIPFEILAITNNCTDNTMDILKFLSKKPGPCIRIVNEGLQGIVPSRNRAIKESAKSDYLIFIDDDELPERRQLRRDAGR